MKKPTFAALLMLATAVAQAQNPELDTLIDAAVRYGQATEGFLWGQQVLAVPVPNKPCNTVGIIYRENRRQRGGPRIDNYQACPGEEPEMIHEVSPALPDDAQFQQIVQMAIRGALRYGTHRRDLYDYHIDARRLSAVDAYGCGQVETVISTMGLLVSYNIGRLCP